jgi:hypothetical protein
MGVLDLVRQYLSTYDKETAAILAAVIVEEQAVADIERPQIKGRIRDVVDAQARVAESGDR